MKEVDLQELAVERRQADIARALGCSPSAITRAIQEGRDVKVRMMRGKIHSAYELKEFPTRGDGAAAAQA